MAKIKELYRAMMSKELLYTHAYNKEQALKQLRRRCLKEFGSYKFTDLQRKLSDGTYTRVPF